MEEFKLSTYLRGKAKAAEWLLVLLVAAFQAQSKTVLFNDSVSVYISADRPRQVIAEARIGDLHFDKFAGNRINLGFVGSGYHYIFS